MNQNKLSFYTENQLLSVCLSLEKALPELPWSFLHILQQSLLVFSRTLFGGSVGPNRRTMSDGTVQNHYEGVKVRVTPLPLRFIGQANSDTQQQHQVVLQNTVPPNPPSSPILTHLLHRKSPAPDQTNPQVRVGVKIQSWSSLVEGDEQLDWAEQSNNYGTMPYMCWINFSGVT